MGIDNGAVIDGDTREKCKQDKADLEGLSDDYWTSLMDYWTR